MSLAPEVLAEQVMGYVIGASELIPTLKPVAKKAYTVAIIPQGPHFYTGLLQAAGYLLLNNQQKKLLIVSQQSDDNKNILIDTNTYETVFGKQRKNSTTKTAKFAHEIGAKVGPIQSKSLYDALSPQLPFIRTITENDAMFHIGIGGKTPQTALKKLCIWIKTQSKNYNIVLLTNIELNKPATSKKTDEQNKLAKIIQTKSISTPLLTIFQKTLSFQKKKPEIIAYVNPSDFGKPGSLTTRYICAIG